MNNKTLSPTKPRSGAALLIAVAILAILTVFAVVFSLQSRVDMNAATNFSNDVRADLIGDAATAITVAFLDHDRDVHPTITALDHAWRTYFDGTWIGGKQWAFDGDMWLTSRDVIPFIDADDADLLGDALYIPRSANVLQDLDQPFLIFDPDAAGTFTTRTRAEQIHKILPGPNLFTDVDNDGDTLRDSMWIPIPADEIFGGIDIDGDGIVSFDEGGDGIDNDLDGFIDEPGELAPFVYWGGNDGFDNDGDDDIDELDEQKLFLTAPLEVTRAEDFGSNGIDDDGDGAIDELDEQDSDLGRQLLRNGFRVALNHAVLLEFSGVAYDDSMDPEIEADNLFGNDWDTIEHISRGPNDVDVLDNDFDFIVNNDGGTSFNEIAIDLDGDAIIEPFEIEAAAQLGARERGFHLINTDVYYKFNRVIGDFIGAKGEPVCFIAGRFAALITDESSKVNIDIAGAHMPNEHYNSLERRSEDSRRPIRRALSQGIGTHEYDMRVLPGIGNENATRVWNRKMGGPTEANLTIPQFSLDGDGDVDADDIRFQVRQNRLFASDTNGHSSFEAPIQADGSLRPDLLDLNLPGYGGVDDNMSSLWMAVNGLDDDGDAEIYQNDGIDNDLNGWIDDPGEGVLVGVDEGLRAYDYDGDTVPTNLSQPFEYDLDNLDIEFANFEGVDDPGEFQLYRPLRNVYLEDGGFDEDLDELYDEFGEASDRVYHARDQLNSLFFVDDSGDSIADQQFRSAAVYPRLLNNNLVTAHSLDGGGRYKHYGDDGSLLLEPVLSGLKLNPNYAMAINPNNAHDPGQFARMLIEDWYYPPSTEDAQQYNLAFQEFEGNLSSVERRFMSGLRQEDVRVTLVPFVSGLFGTMPFDQELRALRLGANLQDFRDSDHVRTESSLAVYDQWFENDLAVYGPFTTTLPRQVEYKMAGIESIRINEIMVRAVRRIEAEATTATPLGNQLTYGDPDVDFSFASSADRDPNVFTAAFDVNAGYQDFDITVENFATRSPYLNLVAPLPPVTVGMSGWGLSGTGILGENEAFFTDQANLSDGSGRSDVIQFRFRPSPSLPPGRYYMMVNVMGADGSVNQEFSEGDIEYAIKYASLTTPLWPADADPLYQKTAGTTDILTDVDAEERRGVLAPVPWNQLDPALPAPVVGTINHPAQPSEPRNTGWVFLPSNAQPGTLATAFPGYGQNGAFTVEIPPFSEDVELCVAIRFTDTNADVPTLSVNFFDFSQEPDHEYIEIVNIEEAPANLSPSNVDAHAIDLSGWEIEVGNSKVTSDAVIMRIPNGTRIAPGDSLLLATNKFDGGIDGNGQTLFSNVDLGSVSDIFKNGIGLVRGPRGVPTGNLGIETTNAFGWITEPAIPRVDVDASAFAGWNVPLNYLGTDVAAPSVATGLTGASVFFRPVDREAVDSNGDGIEDFDLNVAEPLPNASTSTPESEPNFGTVQPTAFGAVPQDPTDPAKAWDRIVQLEIANDSVMFFNESAVSIGELVLRGGVFPNYPELDGVDNDGDNGFLEFDEIDNDGDHDPNGSFDADGDGLFADDFDIFGNFIDDDFDGFVDETDLPDLFENLDESFEGVDEGFVRRYMLPFVPSAGSFDDDPVFFTQLVDGSGQPAYLSNFGESPDWKAFVERRFYPGDNVIVTLYDGPAEDGRVVDRVTYNQRDVENVAIDDDVDVPSLPYLFNAQLPQAWPPNTMGLDFYRSLERKHPVYAGDRFGTRNRWTATDGNYDDWSRGTNRFDELLVDEFGPDPQTNAVVAHGLSGSPLRMNFYHRVLENPVDQFPNAAPLPVNDNRWTFDRARVRNRNLASAGDLMTMSHITFVHGLYTDVASFEATPNLSGVAEQFGIGPLVGMDFPKDLEAMVTSTSFEAVNLSVGQADFYPLYPRADHVIDDGSLAQWNGDATPVAAPRAWSPVFLFPIDFEVNEPLFDFTVPSAARALGDPSDPRLSTEALFGHLFDTTAGAYPFYKYFMFQPPGAIGKIPAGYSEAFDGGEELFDRWPLDRRAVAYVSKNPQDFNPSADDGLRDLTVPSTLDTEFPSEALFVWQGEDGLQNGRYDVYIVTMDNLDDVAFAHIESGENLLTAAGGEVVGSMREFVGGTGNLFGNFQEPDPDVFGVDIEFFTDTDGDRRCWDDSILPNGLPDRSTPGGESELDTQRRVNNDPSFIPESFGQLSGMTPTRDGIIHYGAVDVKNNYLALFIRNWASNTVTNRITRVVLAPRRAASGRINVNTALTRRTEDGELFNPLMGIPGLLYNENVGSITLDNDEPIGLPNGYGDPDPDDLILLDRSEWIVSARQERGTDLFLYPDGERQFYTPFSLLGSQIGNGADRTPDMQYPLSLFNGSVGTLAVNTADPLNDPKDAQGRFNEMQARMSLLANFVTTRSDVFEILITAQPGYVADNNGDGVFNWRDDNEFVPTGEVKRRVIYERSQGDPDGARQ
jgi:hypothetical protein